MAPCQSGEEPYFFLGYITSSPSRYFNPRAPHGARPFRRADRPSRKARNFNPRAPYRARPAPLGHPQLETQQFQSTRPIRGATRAGSAMSSIPVNFNPRAPYGARRTCQRQNRLSAIFQSTRPIRGATHGRIPGDLAGQISIHAPHTGRDPSAAGLGHGGHHISIHAPHTGRDLSISKTITVTNISIHAPHTGRDQEKVKGGAGKKSFQSTRPIRGATKERLTQTGR